MDIDELRDLITHFGTANHCDFTVLMTASAHKQLTQQDAKRSKYSRPLFTAGGNIAMGCCVLVVTDQHDLVAKLQYCATTLRPVLFVA